MTFNSADKKTQSELKKTKLELEECDVSWTKHPAILWTERMYIIPTSSMTENQKKTAVARLIILLTFIIVFTTRSNDWLWIGMTGLYFSQKVAIFESTNRYIHDTNPDPDPLSTTSNKEMTIDDDIKTKLQFSAKGVPSAPAPRPSTNTQVFATRPLQLDDQYYQLDDLVGLADIVSSRL